MEEKRSMGNRENNEHDVVPYLPKLPMTIEP